MLEEERESCFYREEEGEADVKTSSERMRQRVEILYRIESKTSSSEMK